MPPVRLQLALLGMVWSPRSPVLPPLPWAEATLNEYAPGEPMCGCPRRLKRMRSIASTSVAVPTVERGLDPIGSWSTLIAVVSPSRTSTSGRASVGMKPCTNVLYVSLISRCDSAAIVSKTSELLPEPETPVNAVSRRFGISTLTSLRLFSRAPCTRIRSWRSGAAACVSMLVAKLIVAAMLGAARRARFSIPAPSAPERERPRRRDGRERAARGEAQARGPAQVPAPRFGEPDGDGRAARGRERAPAAREPDSVPVPGDLRGARGERPEREPVAVPEQRADPRGAAARDDLAAQQRADLRPGRLGA